MSDEEKDVNCTSYALYMARVIPEDKFISPYDVHLFLDKLEPTENPGVGDIIAFRALDEDREAYHHLGIVKYNNPIFITQRVQRNAYIDDFTLKKLKEDYFDCEIIYFKPEKLFGLYYSLRRIEE